MTQKSNLFKGQPKRKVIAPNRHGKPCQTRKGKRVVKPSKVTKEMDADRGSRQGDPLSPYLCVIAMEVLSSLLMRAWEGGFLSRFKEVSKFINHCNEVKAATVANKEGWRGNTRLKERGNEKNRCVIDVYVRDVEVEERENSEKDGEERAEEEKEKREDEEHKDLEKGEEGFEEQVGRGTPQPQGDFHVSMLQRLNPSNPLRVAIPGVTRATTPSPAQPRSTSTPTPQQTITTLNSTAYTNRISLFLFLLHAVLAVGLVCFLIFKGIQGLLEPGQVQRKERKLLKYFLPQVEAASLLSITLAFAWQKAFCFQRALSRNLGSACLGSTFVPAIEALRIVARGLNLLEGEDEFMFSCAHCCLHIMESIFRYGNGWAYVQIAAYGKGFVKASQDTWELFEKRGKEMEAIVDSDITSAICFLAGVCSGSMCTIVVAAWTFSVHEGFTATLSLLAFFVGYLMARIAMALPHACVSCYYVCYAENPDNRLFDKTIPDRLNLIKSGRDVVVPTPRVPRHLPA
uniref:Choline transporter-like protein n=1 Tax=Vitis vinifera TaxID=29760 RepID=A5BAL4_VITVI|nr:hypothetical protein VITISV_013772 [Vitis vinifera]